MPILTSSIELVCYSLYSFSLKYCVRRKKVRRRTEIDNLSVDWYITHVRKLASDNI